MVMECTERLAAPPNLCQYEKIKCTTPCVNGSKFCSKHVNSHQCSYFRGGTQCKNRIAGTEQRTLCTTHLQVKASRKRRRTEAPAHKDLVNKTPPYALHVFRIMTQERQRLKFKPNIKKRPLEHLKWVLKRERLEKNPVYPSGMENECNQYDTPHDNISLDDGVPLKQTEMSDIRSRSVYLSKMEEHLHKRLDHLVYQVNAYRRTQSQLSINTRAITEAARSSVTKTTQLLNGNESSSSKELCPCSLANRAARYSCCVCNKRALPFTKYCVNHILHDGDQLLFSKCNTVMPQSMTESCPTPTVSSTGRPCTLHSLLERFGVTESSDIVEMESSCSESEPDEDVEPPSLDSCVNSAPTSPKVTKTKIPSPLPDNHHPPPPEVSELDMDMLPMQPDTILESSLLPDEPDIPLSVRFLEPSAHPTNKRIRTKEEEMQARMSPFMKFPGHGGAPAGYFPYPYNYNAPATFLHGYNKEGEPIYGYHDNKQHEYQKYLARQHSTSGSDSSRPTTPIINPEMMAHYYQQQQRFMHPANSPAPVPTPEPKKDPAPAPKKKKQKKKKTQPVVVATPTKQEKARETPPPQIPNPYSSQDSGGGSPNSAASPATMALLKSKLAEPKKDNSCPATEISEPKPPSKSSSKKNQGSKNTPPKTPVSHPQEFTAVMMPPQQPAMMNPRLQMQPGQANYYSYGQQAMYPGHPVNQQYYLQMFMQPGGVAGAVPGGMTPQQPPATPLPEQEQSPANNGPVAKEQPPKSGDGTVANSGPEAAGPELNEFHLRNTLTQQRQRQMMIAAQSQGMNPGQYSYPQQFQYYQSFPPPSPAGSPKPEKKRKKQPPKEKNDKDVSNVQKKKPSLNSPTSKDNQLSSLQSLMSTASSGRLPLETVLPDSEPIKPPSKPRSKKSSAKEDSGNEMRGPQTTPHSLQTNFANYAAYYQGYTPVQGHVVMGPMKGYVNGTAGPLYFRMDEPVEMGQDNKPVVINDAVLARNRPSTVLMKNPGWVEKFIKKPENSSEKGRSKSKMNSSPRRSPQKSQHRNLIFHNTEIGTISDKLAKQQKNAEQRSSHRAMCAKSKVAEQALPPPSSNDSNNNNHPPAPPPGNNVYHPPPEKGDKVPVFLPDKHPVTDSLPLNSQPEGVT